MQIITFLVFNTLVVSGFGDYNYESKSSQSTSKCGTNSKWPNGIVKYELDVSLKFDDITTAFHVFHSIEQKTCLRFQQKYHGETGFVRILRDSSERSNPKSKTDKDDDDGCIQNIIINDNADTSVTSSILHSLRKLIGLEGNEREEEELFCDNDDSKINFGLNCDHSGKVECNRNNPEKKYESQFGNQNGRKELTILEAEKLNEIHDCQGCFRHRWRNAMSLSEDERQVLTQFGESNDGDPIYLCRAFINGEVIPGKFVGKAGTCYIAYNGKAHRISSTPNKVQVFTVANNTVTTTVGKYSNVHVAKVVSGRGKGQFQPIPVGLSADGTNIYAAIAYIRHKDVSIGKVISSKLDTALFPFYGEEVRETYYNLFVCQEQVVTFENEY